MKPVDEIIRLLRGELTDAEKQDFYKRLEHDSALKELFVEQKNVWVKTGVQPVLSPAERVADFNSIWSKVLQSPGKSRFQIFLRYAAIVIFALMIGSIGGYIANDRLMELEQVSSPLYTFSSGDRSMSEVTLPDGSRLRLNAQSKITFQKDHKTNERLVTLEGEAFFDVVHDEESPFIIDFGNLKIVDLGTAFNVKAYQNHNHIETALMEGAVDIRVAGQKVASLIPGQKAVCSRSGDRVEVSAFNAQNELAWTRNRFIFQDVPLIEIMEALSDWYNVKVTWQNKARQNTNLHLSLQRNNSLETMMELLKMSVDIDYELIRGKDGLKEIVIR